MSLEKFRQKPTDITSPRPTVEQIPMEELTANQKVRKLQQMLRGQMGNDWNPVLRLAQLAEELIEEGDTKTAIIALNSVADRLHPKLKAHEIADQTTDVIVVNGDPNQRPTQKGFVV